MRVKIKFLCQTSGVEHVLKTVFKYRVKPRENKYKSC